jgi:hypothetical protein
MIILSIGMPRAGSGWHYNLTNDLMLANGAQNARQIRQKYHLQSILTEVNCNIGALTSRRLLPVMVPSMFGNTFVIKAHAGPTPLALQFIQRGWVQPTYIYRDPRDALLSAIENGKRAREAGRVNAFSQLVDFDTALNFMLDYLHIWEAWMQCQQALHVRYEDMLTSYDDEAERLLNFLGLDKENTKIQTVISKYRPENAQSDQKGIHFSQGKIGRFRKKMTVEQQDAMNAAFESYLTKMEYEI